MTFKLKTICLILLVPFFNVQATELNLTLSPEIISTLFESVNNVLGDSNSQCRYHEHPAGFSQSSSDPKLKEKISLKIMELATNSLVDQSGRVLTQIELNSIIQMIAEHKMSPQDLENIYYNLSSYLSKKLTIVQTAKVVEAIRLVSELRKDMLDFELFGARCFYATGITYEQVLGKNSALTGLADSLNKAHHTEVFKPREDEYIIVGKCRGKEVLYKLESESAYK